MIFATGDTHGNFLRFDKRFFPQQFVMSREDYVIICGDFGGVWNGSKAENDSMDWLNKRPFTTLFVDGNHENYDRLACIPQEDWHGGKVQRIRPHILYLMRGQLFDIEGYTFFTMGGAASHDVKDGILDPDDPEYSKKKASLDARGAMYRVNHGSWWQEEMPSDEEYARATAALKQANWKVDYVLAHCAPTSIVRQLNKRYDADRLTDYFDTVIQRLEFYYWLFGHYHENRNIGQNYVLLYEQIVQVL